MVGQICRLKLEDILNEKQLHHVVNRALGREDWELVGCEMRPAVDGLCGFVGDHYRATVTVKLDGEDKKTLLFIKNVPRDNKPKADYIDENKFFKREMWSLKLCADFCGADEPNPWCTKALFSNESTLVMPDLSALGYTLFPKLKSFDLAHALVAAASLARFHAACANYETKMSQQLGRRYTVLEVYGTDMIESTFTETPWLHGAAKVSVDLLNQFSDKYSSKNIPDLDKKIMEAFLVACDMLTEHPDTLNVLIHKDLWANNIMFRYDKGLPVDAVLVDFQCVRYAPPAFDVTAFLYLTTTKSFREQHEADIFKFYYSIFLDKIDSPTEQRLKDLKYDEDEFLKWCEKCRMFGLVQTIAILPYALMDQKVAQKTFDDPETYDRYLEDRSEPILAHCRDSEVYLDLQLQASEEFVERYVLDKL